MRTPSRIADILRDFVEVHRHVRLLAARHRATGLRFPDLDALIRDDEGSVLFRLKERTHALFRDPAHGDGGPTHRQALFDLAVGSLFHEAMKLRENLYQREVYGPRVRALRSEAGEESKALFDEFEKMLGSSEARLDEGVRELEALSSQTADQLRLLVGEPPDDGAARFLTERDDEVETVFGVPVRVLLEEMYGSVARGFERAGLSYLRSGSFAAAAERFGRALEEGSPDSPVEGLRDYARGMHAYLARDYAGSVEWLARWAAAGPADPELLPLARDAVGFMAQLAGDDWARTSRDASELLTRLGGPERRRSTSPRRSRAS